MKRNLFKNFKQIEKKGLWSLIVEDGMIKVVEGQNELDISNQSFSEIYDLHGNYLLPSFTDAHMHLSLYAILFTAVDLRNCTSIRELQNKLRNETSVCVFLNLLLYSHISQGDHIVIIFIK